MFLEAYFTYFDEMSLTTGLIQQPSFSLLILPFMPEIFLVFFAILIIFFNRALSWLFVNDLLIFLLLYFFAQTF
jgi:hypothetical protein